MTKIMGIDLGKFKSVACLFNSADGEYSYRTLRTTPVALRELLTGESPDRVGNRSRPGVKNWSSRSGGNWRHLGHVAGHHGRTDRTAVA